MTPSIARRGGAHPREGVLKTIAVFKLIKALLLVGVGLGAFKLLDPATADAVHRWAATLAWHLGPRAASALQDGLSSVPESKMKMIGTVAFLYAALFSVEGVGLWMAKRWAEYLTIIATSSLVPFEVYELVKRATWQRGAALGVNVLVVAYLIWKVRQREA